MGRYVLNLNIFDKSSESTSDWLREFVKEEY